MPSSPVIWAWPLHFAVRQLVLHLGQIVDGSFAFVSATPEMLADWPQEVSELDLRQ